MEPKKLKLSFLIGAVMFLSSAAFGQASTEGYDPMLQITHQFAHPNLLLVLDITGSMASEATTETNVGVDSVGSLPSWSQQRYNKGTSPCGANAYKFITTLKKGKNPSRMCIVKNALGNSVSLYEWNNTAVPASTWQAMPVNAGWVWYGMDANSQPQWYQCKSSNPSNDPFTVTNNLPGLVVYPPKDLIGTNKNSVNWGVVVYSQNYGNCNQATVKTTFDLNETGNVTALEELFELSPAAGGHGLGCGGYTCTRGAMKFAKEYLSKSATGGTIDDYDNTNHAVGRDNKFFSCDRTYGVVLVTDGLSNACNENDVISTANPPPYKNWINPCGAAPYDCDMNAGAGDCDRRSGKNRNFNNYPAGRINELWNATVVDPNDGTTHRLNARTWVIGVSSFVNACELNFNAYMGRTDASSPNGDAGFRTGEDLARLPHMNTVTDPETGRVSYTTLIDNEEGTSHYNSNDPRTTGDNYAYFATNANALADAFADIIAGMATGDYTTSSPVGTPGSAGGGDLAYVATADFPDWNGHLYCYNTAATPSVLVWDAGEKLTAQSSASRKIYTWDSSYNLVEFNSANLATLKTIATTFTPSFDPATLTAQVVDFTRGNDGSGAARSWKFGASMNSTPTIVGKPVAYEGGTVNPSHLDFQSNQSGRKPLLYVGSDDGMMHAFLITDETDTNAAYEDGNELFAILPPNLICNQVTLYNNFHNGITTTGQAKRTGDHIYGVANSPRYGDVYFPGETKWRTMLFLTEGPGGKLVGALDITNPFEKMTLPTPEPPVSVIWSISDQTCPELKDSWSMPAIGPVSSESYTGIIGTGYDKVNNVTSPYILSFDPRTGTLTKKAISATAGSYLRNQAFADSVIFQTDYCGYFEDNLVDIGLQADLNGKIWFYNVAGSSVTAGISVSPEPIYYSPAVSGFKKGTDTYDIYAFATGTQYEKDPDITGSTIGSGNNFTPKIYIGVQTPWSDVPSVQLASVALKNLTYTYEDSNGDDQIGQMGPRTQVTASPTLIVSIDGKNDPMAVFACYDPDTVDCAGTSYIVLVTVHFGNNGAPSLSTSGTSAGSGAISGFAIVGNKVVVAKSGVGEGQRATLSKVEGVTLNNLGGPPMVNWWRELQ